MNKEITKYLSKIGSIGGKKSKRALDSQTAHQMVMVREARRAYKNLHSICFWSYDPDYIITKSDIPWVAEQLMKHGDRKAWEIGVKLLG